jgi:hypothetical protein
MVWSWRGAEDHATTHLVIELESADHETLVLSSASRFMTH